MPKAPPRFEPIPRPKSDRPSAARRGYGYRWQQESRRFLRLHPLCVLCDRRGVAAAATVVDHRTPHRGDQTLFWDIDNWDPLCKPCHDAKTAAGR